MLNRNPVLFLLTITHLIKTGLVFVQYSLTVMLALYSSRYILHRSYHEHILPLMCMGEQVEE